MDLAKKKFFEQFMRKGGNQDIYSGASLPQPLANLNLKISSGQSDHSRENGTRQDEFGRKTMQDDWPGFKDGGHPE